MIGLRAAGSLALLCTAAVATSWRAAELGRSVNSAWSTPQVLRYHDAGAFRSAWAQLFLDAGRRPALPAVDFSKWQVVIVAAGAEPTGGFRLVLDSARATRDSAWISVTLIHPPAGCGVIEQITHPAVAVAVPSTPMAVRVIHLERADTTRCH
jgi:hypothetical protein